MESSGSSTGPRVGMTPPESGTVPPREGPVLRSPRWRGTDVDEPRGLAILQRVSWSSIFAGTVVTLVLMLTLNMLGIGVGLLSIDPTTENNPLGGLGTGAAIWWFITWLVALFAGGWVAGRLSGRMRSLTGALHGVVTWGLSSIVVFWMLGSGVSSVVGAATSLTGQVLRTAGSGIAGIITNTSMPDQQVTMNQDMRAAARQQLEQAGLPPDLVDLRMQEIQRAANQVLVALVDPNRELDRQAIVNIIAQNTQLTQAEANQIASRWEDQVAYVRSQSAEIEQQTRATAERVANTAGIIAVLSFFVLLLGGIAATIGGWVGTPHEVPVVATERKMERVA